MRKIVVAITGASGSLYAVSLLDELVKRRDIEIHTIFSRMGEKVMRFECDRGPGDFSGTIRHDCENMFSAIASGSHDIDSMVVVPCTMNTLSCIAGGISNNLLQRAAEVMLKEKRRLLLVPRESPIGSIHLENMLRLSRSGAVIVPACPGFYHRPQSLEDLVRHLTGKILDLLEIPHGLFPPWEDPFKGNTPTSAPFG